MIEAKLEVVFKESLPESLGISAKEMFIKNVHPDANDKKQTKVIHAFLSIFQYF